MLYVTSLRKMSDDVTPVWFEIPDVVTALSNPDIVGGHDYDVVTVFYWERCIDTSVLTTCVRGAHTCVIMDRKLLGSTSSLSRTSRLYGAQLVNLTSRPPGSFCCCQRRCPRSSHMISFSTPALPEVLSRVVFYSPLSLCHPTPLFFILSHAQCASLGDMKFAAKVSGTSCPLPDLTSRFGPEHSYAQISYKFCLRSILTRIHDSAEFSLA